MSTEEMIDSAVEHLHVRASVKTVYGDPIAVDGKTIIPVAKVAYGFGGGTGTKQTPPVPEGKPSVADEAGEGAGGVSAKPVGVVEISGAETKFVPFGQTKKLTIAAAIGSALGLLFGFFLGRRR
jgi:uncharacterized spore protein YtfJ